MQTLDLVYSRRVYAPQEGNMDTTEIKKVIADRIGKRRAAIEGMSQEKLEELTGIDQPQLSRYETAQTAPSMATIIKLAKALDCTVGYLIGAEDNPKPPDLLSSLSEDERGVLETYRDRRIALEREILNEEIDKIAKPQREHIRRLIAALQTTGKIDSRRDNP